MSKKTKIIQKREECIGCGSCTIVCQKFWKMNEKDMKADLIGGKINDSGEYELEIKNISAEDLDCNKQAADVCPVKIIKII
ncbi:MAG: hypothetical protein Athens071426_571 [Parcubacteria group bacterium Athens0714_26]|nr:MAG: hypothetical protein Athens071426_571 [Parcubacteria group bacterium Athens0714_26]